MDAYGARQLSDTRYRQLYLFAGSHYQVAKLVDYHHDIWHKLMSVLRIELAVLEFLVVFLDVARSRYLQQVVACVHLLAQRVERAHHLGHVGDDGFGSLVGHHCEEVLFERSIDRELHLLGVNEHYLQFCRMLLI